MDRRKIYILTILIIMALLTGLAVWYSYITKKAASITKTQDITIPAPTTLPTAFGNPPAGNNNNTETNTSSNKTGTGTQPTQDLKDQSNKGEVVKPTKWVLKHVYTDPTLKLNTNSEELYYTDAKTGVINSYSPTKDEHTTISQDTLPNLREVYSLPNKHYLIIPKDSRPYISKITDSTLVKQATIYDDILQVALTDKALYYLTHNDISGVSIKRLPYTKLNASKVKPTTLWSSPLSNWLLQTTPNSVYITQKASNNIPGYSYLISNKGYELTLARDLPGLITNLSPDTETLLYSTTGEGGTELYIKNMTTRETTQLYTPTLANKCAWSSDSLYIYCAIPYNLKYSKNLPDSWYKGKTHFSDSLWRINTNNGEALELKKFTGLDITDLHILGEAILFKNKRDQSIWSIIKE